MYKITQIQYVLYKNKVIDRFMIEEFIDKLLKEDFKSFEICPPRSASIKPFLTKIKAYALDKSFDAFIATDNPLAKVKYDTFFASLAIQREFQKPCIATLGMRDRNLLALQSALLGANDFDIRSILTLTGDNIKRSDHKDAKAVFEGNSTLLLKIIKALNENKTFVGQKLSHDIKPIYPFSVCNSYDKDMSKLKFRMMKKISLGTKAIFMQPSYDLANAKELLSLFNEAKKELGVSEVALVLGFFPISSYKVANFLYTKLPGVYIPDFWLDEMQKAAKISKDKEFELGLELSRSLFKDLNKYYNKMHIMSANNLKIINQILKD